MPSPDYRRSAITGTLETRQFTVGALEIRSASSADSNLVTITGAPIVYNVPYQVFDRMGEYTERMAPGVVRDLLARGTDTRFLINHDGLALARTNAGTLKLTDTPRALTFAAQLDRRQALAKPSSAATFRKCPWE